MCSGIDDTDGTHEEEGCHRNQDALSASNGLPLDLHGGTSEFNWSGVEGMKGVGWKAEKGKCISKRRCIWWI